MQSSRTPGSWCLTRQPPALTPSLREESWLRWRKQESRSQEHTQSYSQQMILFTRDFGSHKTVQKEQLTRMTTKRIIIIIIIMNMENMIMIVEDVVMLIIESKKVFL